jgi:type IX secretion system PorP/SprF family membrane protein
MNIARTILLITILSGTTAAYAQEPVFSQFYSSGLYLNPALAGVESETFLGANYRSQWSNLALPFNTFQASFIHPLFQRGMKKQHLGGVGASMLNDVAGPSKEFVSQAVSIAGAWNIHLNSADNHVLTVAVQTGLAQQRVNYDNLQWSSQYSSTTGFDPSMPGESSMSGTRISRPILNTGLIWSYSTKKTRASKKGVSFYNGISLSNLAKAKSYFPGAAGERSVIFKSHGGVTTSLSKNLELSPNYLFQVQGGNRQLNIGAYAGYSLAESFKIIGGAWYRMNDGIILSTGIATRKLNVGFSYDNNMVSMGKTFGYAGAYELSLAYRIPGKDNFRRISSPLI